MSAFLPSDTLQSAYGTCSRTVDARLPENVTLAAPAHRIPLPYPMLDSLEFGKLVAAVRGALLNATPWEVSHNEFEALHHLWELVRHCDERRRGYLC